MDIVKLSLDTAPGGAIAQARQVVAEQSWLRTSDAVLGLPSDFHHHVSGYLTDATLGDDLPGFEPTGGRKRARDVIEYRRTADGLLLAEYPRITLPPRYSVKTSREYNRIFTLGDPLFAQWLATLLELIPPGSDEWFERGTVGVNFFRTFRDVVPFPHQDEEPFVCVYVVDRKAEGATTILYRAEDLLWDSNGGRVLAPGTEPLFEATLTPGEWFVFRDDVFAHTATPLRPRWPSDTSYHRDVLVVTVHKPSSYPEEFIPEV